MRYGLFIAAALGLAACASSGGTDAGRERLALDEDKRVGQRQSTLCFRRAINGFSAYEEKEEGVVLRRGASDEYLVTFTGNCAALGFAQRLGFDERFGTSGCLRAGDRLWLDTRLGGSADSRSGTELSSCLIRDIYEYDSRADQGGNEAQ